MKNQYSGAEASNFYTKISFGATESMECHPASGVCFSRCRAGLDNLHFSKFLGDAGDAGPGTSLRSTVLEEGPESIGRF